MLKSSLTFLLVFGASALAHVHLAGIVGQSTLSAGPSPDSTYAKDCRGCSDPNFDASHSLDVTDYSTTKATCNGKAKGTPNITLKAGTVMSMEWRVDITHPGPAAIYMSFDNDKTWVLLAQAIEIFIGESPGEPDLFDAGNKGNFLNVVWDVKLPANLPSSQNATLRGEFFNIQAPEAYVSCIDVITQGSDTAQINGFAITGTPQGFSHVPGLGTGDSATTPYPNYDLDTNFVTNNIGYNNFVQNIWTAKLGGPAITEFGVHDFALNQQATHQGNNFPGTLSISGMNPLLSSFSTVLRSSSAISDSAANSATPTAPSKIAALVLPSGNSTAVSASQAISAPETKLTSSKSAVSASQVLNAPETKLTSSVTTDNSITTKVTTRPTASDYSSTTIVKPEATSAVSTDLAEKITLNTVSGLVTSIADRKTVSTADVARTSTATHASATPIVTSIADRKTVSTADVARTNTATYASATPMVSQKVTATSEHMWQDWQNWQSNDGHSFSAWQSGRAWPSNSGGQSDSFRSWLPKRRLEE